MHAATLLHKSLQPFSCSLSNNSLSPHTQTMNLPPLPREIWLEIMQFATYVHQNNSIVPLHPFAERRISSNAMAVNTQVISLRTKLSLVLVCRSWRSIALQLLYNHLPIRSPLRAELLLDVLERSAQGPSELRLYHGQWTRHIEIYTHARRAGGLPYLKSLFRILQACPNLRILSGNWNHRLPLDFLEAISNKLGPSLQGLYWNDHAAATWPKTSAATPKFLASFVALRVLDIRNYGGKGDAAAISISLPSVQDLILSNASPCINVATILDLPALQNLVLKTYPVNATTPVGFLTPFLQAHGASLISVDVHPPSSEFDFEAESPHSRRITCFFNPDIFLESNLCPNLETLTFPASSPPFSPGIKHPLRRIGLRGVRADTMYPDKDTITRKHLMSFTPDRYPNLEVIRTIGFLADADTDGLIKDIFIWWVQRFEKQGIDFLDGEGVLWAYTDSTTTLIKD